MATIETSEPYFIAHAIWTTLNEMERAAHISVCRSSAASFASGLVKMSTLSILNVFHTCWPGSCGTNIWDTELHPSFLRARYLIKRYMPTIPDTDVIKEFIREPVVYEKAALLIFSTDRFRSFGDRRKYFVLVPSCGTGGGGLWAAKVLLLFRIRVVASIEIHKYAFGNTYQGDGPIDMVDETLQCVCLTWSTADEVEQGLG